MREQAMTSGPFLVSPEAATVDWVVVNNDTNPVDIHVTIYRLNLSATKVVYGPESTFTVDPDGTYHNANNLPTGYYYEIVIDSSSGNILPAVSQWSCSSGSCYTPETLIPSGVFIVSKVKI